MGLIPARILCMNSSMEILELLSSYKSGATQVVDYRHRNAFRNRNKDKMYNTNDHSLVEATYCVLCSQAQVQMYTEFLWGPALNRMKEREFCKTMGFIRFTCKQYKTIYCVITRYPCSLLWMTGPLPHVLTERACSRLDWVHSKADVTVNMNNFHSGTQ